MKKVCKQCGGMGRIGQPRATRRINCQICDGEGTVQIKARVPFIITPDSFDDIS